MMKKNLCTKPLSVLIALLICSTWGNLLFSTPGYGQSARIECFSTLWPHEKSALVPDPAVLYGKLDNGFRYAIMENSLPEDRVAMYLYVDAGSINEQDNERGYAHFLEHMLFNGSKHFPPGKLIEYFQSIGMNFGADSNAYTTYDRTVYTIVLPENDKKSIADGLLVISDYAREALLLDSEVDKERGVILAEKTSRDSVEYRTSIATRKNALKGTLAAERQPIGTVAALKGATGSSLKAFYNKWYRPENMTLVVVGDLDKEEMEKSISEKFGTMRGEGPIPQCPDIGYLQDRGVHSFYYPEAEAGDVSISLESHWNKDWQNDSFALQVKVLKEYIAGKILEKRLQKIAEKDSSLLAGPRVYSGDIFDRIGYSGASISTTENKWQKSLEVLEKTLRQAILYGITEGELAIVKHEIATYYTSQVQKQLGRESTDLASQIIYYLSNNRVFQSPLQEKNNYVPVLDLLTVDDINQTIVGLFDRSETLVEVTGSLSIKEQNPAEKILAAYTSAKMQPVQKYVKKEAEEFPYIEPVAGRATIREHTHHEDIDVDEYHFENGAVLFLKNTDYKKNEVEVLVEFGPGKLGETKPGLALLTEEVVAKSGTSRMSASAIQEALAGSSVNFNFAIDKTRFSLSGGSLKDDAELLINSLFTLYRDPGFKEDAYRNGMIRFGKMYESLRSDIHGAEELYFKKFFAGGSSLFGMPLWQDISGVTLGDIASWAKEIYAESTPQISVVGDFNREQMVRLIASSFGNLPAGKIYPPQTQHFEFPYGKVYETPLPSKLDKSLVVAGWHTDGFTDIHKVRRLSMLSAAMEERLRLTVREKLGAAYSPVVYHAANRSIPNFGMVYVRIIVEEDKIEDVRQAVLEIAKDLYNNGVSEDELDRVKKPRLTSLKDAIKTNDYWLKTVLSQSDLFPKQLKWPTSIIEDYTSITTAEMSAYAKEYLAPEKAAIAIARPQADE